MSRAGKYPVKLSEGVSVAIADNALVVKGPKGELKLALDTKNAGLVDIVINEGQVVINPKDSEEKSSRTMWGTMARNIRNAVEGVSKGFEKPMYMKDWIEHLKMVLTMNRKSILEDAGRISHQMALQKADEEYSKYKHMLRVAEHLESIKELNEDLKRLQE